MPETEIPPAMRVDSLSNKEVSSEGMKPPSEIKREKEEEKGERVGMAGVP